jgi:hypothetical protein
MQPGHYEAPPFQGQPYPLPQQQFAVQPPPGYYFAAPRPVPTPLLPQRPTPLTVWGLQSSIGAFVLPFVGIGLEALYWRFEPLTRVFILLAPVAAVLGVVLSSIAMSHRYTRRGLAIAGLVIGIVGVVLVLGIAVSLLTSL